MNWETPPYNHSWEKNIDSIMNTGSKITFPQFVVEMVIYNRSKYIKSFPKIEKGLGWSNAISKQVRGLCQQSYVICNFFEHPSKENLVSVAFKNVFRNQRIFKIGQFRKVRVDSKGKLNITQDEKDIILAINAELENLKKQRNSFKTVQENMIINNGEVVKFRLETPDISSGKKKRSLQDLIKLEQKNTNGEK